MMSGTEVQHQRIVRELKLEAYLKKNSIGVRMMGDDLEITCMKAPNADDHAWSELVCFDTRASLLRLNFC